MKTLRWYQQEAVDSVFAYWGRAPARGSPVIVLPTGSGKSLVLAELTRRLREYGARVLVATHRAELITQDAAAIRGQCSRLQLGVYSAGLGESRVCDVTVAGVQSAFRKAHVFGHIDVVIIDEAHLVSTKSGTQYHRLVEDLRAVNPDLRLVGLTATPYRLGQGLITQGEGHLFDSICYEAPVLRLIEEGFLARVVSGGAVGVKTDDLAIRAGEFALDDMALAFSAQSVTDRVIEDVRTALAAGRTSAMLFGVNVKHAEQMCAAARFWGLKAEVVTGETPKDQRARVLAAFARRDVQVLSSCDVLTTGFDAPCVDVLALVRATMSPGLYVQMVGRGMRMTEGKADCLVLDYGGNILRHGPIDDVKKPRPKTDGKAPVKVCPSCDAEVATAARVCPHCGHEWPPPETERKANASASKLGVLSTDGAQSPESSWQTVGHVEATKHIKAGDPNAPPTLKVSYHRNAFSSWPIASEWVCLEHGGFAGEKAERWWQRHVKGCRMPRDVDDAVGLIDAGWMPKVTAIRVEPDGKYKRVKEVRQEPIKDKWDQETEGEEPAGMSPMVFDDDDDLPF